MLMHCNALPCRACSEVVDFPLFVGNCMKFIQPWLLSLCKRHLVLHHRQQKDWMLIEADPTERKSLLSLTYSTNPSFCLLRIAPVCPSEFQYENAATLLPCPKLVVVQSLLMELRTIIYSDSAQTSNETLFSVLFRDACQSSGQLSLRRTRSPLSSPS